MNPLKAIYAAMLLVFVSHATVAQEPAVAPPPVAPQAEPEPEPTVLDKFPNEVKHGGTRLFDIQVDPPPGALLANGSSITLKFKYETDQPGNLFVGGFPFTKPGEHAGGYQPAQLTEKQGTAEMRIFVGVGQAPAKPITTLDELRASYLPLQLMEISFYGNVRAKWQMPIRYSVIPAANFTVQEKFYLERLIKEVLALRKRVEELEAKGN